MLWQTSVQARILTLLVILQSSLVCSEDVDSSLPPIGVAVTDALGALYPPYCTAVVLGEDSHLSNELFKRISHENQMSGIFIIDRNRKDGNATLRHLQDVITRARQVRRLSKCSIIITFTEDPLFLEVLAQQFLVGRLLVWNSRLLVVSSKLSFLQMDHLLRNYWTFSMTNSAFLQLEGEGEDLRGKFYAYFPYGPAGANVVQVGSWSHRNGLQLPRNSYFYAEKYNNFFGSMVNVTALPYTPHWLETKTTNPDGSIKRVFGGTDYRLLSTIAQSLNFTINVLSTASWDEVATRVEERVSFMATVFHNVLPQRLDRYDYSYTYEYGSLDFSVAKPGLKPQWQALYYPLTDEVWLAILGVLVFMPLLLKLTNLEDIDGSIKQEDVFHLFMETVFGTLLSQPLLNHLPKANSFRLVLGTWLIFAFIVGTAYRSNLTASLTIPKYPPRVETVEQLVETFDSITMPPFGNEFIRFFKQSDNQLYKSMAERMSIVPSVMDGLKRALYEKEAHVAGARFMQQKIARFFSSPDGSTLLYVGRESILPGISAWPIPHDAPYRPQLDRVMMTVIEGGLYEQWSREMLSQAQRDSRETTGGGGGGSSASTEDEGEGISSESSEDNRSKALTIIHMQGPLMLLLLGLIASLLLFLSEIIAKNYLFGGKKLASSS